MYTASGFYGSEDAVARIPFKKIIHIPATIKAFLETIDLYARD